MARLTIRIDLGKDAALGPGKARLLELIDQKGSIRGAAMAMNMSYRRAWLLLRETDAMMRAPMVAAETGGVGGGGTSLTEFGRTVVERYRAIEARAERSVDAELRELARMTKRTLSSRGPTPTRAKSVKPARRNARNH
jgi:molybdate transport system regulatory protein